MKKLLFFLLLGATAQAQITTRCKVCPPSLEGVPDGYVLRDSSGFARWQFVANDTLSQWSLTGNSGTNPATNFIGTTDNMPLVTKTNGIERMRVSGSGNVGIGITSSDIDSNKLTVIGGFFDSVPTTYGYALANIGRVAGGLFEGVYFTNGYSKIQLTYDTLLPNKTNYHYSLGNEISKVEGDSLKSSGLAGEGEVRFKFANEIWIADDNSLYAQNGIGTIGYSANPVGGVYTDGLKLTDGTQGAGKVLTSDASGLASWQGGIIYDSLTSLTGQTITLTNNSTHIAAASGTITDVTWNFPIGTTGDVLDIENMQVITTLNITGTGTGTITAAKITNSKTAGLKTFHNYGGNWY